MARKRPTAVPRVVGKAATRLGECHSNRCCLGAMSGHSVLEMSWFNNDMTVFFTKASVS